MDRRTELAGRLEQVRERIASACAKSGRDACEVTLVVVTKFFPASDVALLYELGCREFGESRDQEARAKAAQLAEAAPQARWHMIGQIQRNKAKSIASWAHVVQSVDDSRLVAAFEKTAQPLDVLVQVSLDGDEKRSGAAAERVFELADQVEAASNLRLKGLMAIPPLGADPAQAFAALAALHAALKAAHPDATALSAGMSGDFETAIAAGSSCVRVGAAILGSRPIPSP
ncbi:alanine racemase domain protein [Segniliparus rotundus DSM 44985]|uniref:Pyridoxal phosphate homeostasis protein n=1 Tax=Segniliparus rotundus (strain ATCC BAA-972 / CDC 1076 / CIP 108378 / DSM 44985 / JCM 13578) TaxID=640132 RepID=D6ZC34_SEGRD|nr:YggS family pyridoxal phosphate-dependent enzyme [Segniliparus rotundus]ADG99003.1 alanine racemase domain protein [Segniliparus rotundus DSM 44985]